MFMNYARAGRRDRHRHLLLLLFPCIVRAICCEEDINTELFKAHSVIQFLRQIKF